MITYSEAACHAGQHKEKVNRPIQCLLCATSGNTKRSDMDHTVLLANYTMPAFCFASIHQTAPPLTEVEGIWLELTTHSSIQKGWKAELAWVADLQWMLYPHKWLTISYRSSGGQGSLLAKDRRSTAAPRNQPVPVYRWQTVHEMGMVTSCDPVYISRPPIISQE